MKLEIKFSCHKKLDTEWRDEFFILKASLERFQFRGEVQSTKLTNPRNKVSPRNYQSSPLKSSPSLLFPISSSEPVILPQLSDDIQSVWEILCLSLPLVPALLPVLSGREAYTFWRSTHKLLPLAHSIPQLKRGGALGEGTGAYKRPSSCSSWSIHAALGFSHWKMIVQ